MDTFRRSRGSGSGASCQLRANPWKARQIVFREGDEGGFAYYVRKGLVRTFQTLNDGRSQGLRLIGEGGLFGLSALRTGRHRATAETVAPSMLCPVPLPALWSLAQANTTISKALCQSLLAELDEFRSLLHGLSLRRSQVRVAAFLAARPEEGPALPPDLHQRDIAELLGVTPETVCRVVATFRRQGILEPATPGLRVRNREALQKIAAEDA